MKEQFVTYEIAKKLKELGFNEPCIAFGNPTIKDDFIAGRITEPIQNNDWFILIPLWQQVIDWLREEHNLQVYVKSNTVNMKGNYIDWIYIVGDTILDSRNGFDTYEEAREKAILTALNLI